ncbi:MAG: alpha-hydroxy-acid oxidizing protein, partial [Gemmatimonas sp.]
MTAPLRDPATDTRDSFDIHALLSVSDFETAAMRVLPHTTREFLAAGAGDELTLRWNRDSFDRIRIRPRVMRGVTTVDTSLSLLGRPLRTPIILAPTAYHRVLHPEGEVATA